MHLLHLLDVVYCKRITMAEVKKEVPRIPRVVFDWEKNYVPRKQTEPPLPVSKPAQQHTQNPYV